MENKFDLISKKKKKLKLIKIKLKNLIDLKFSAIIF